jgi:hypothetical protein
MDRKRDKPGHDTVAAKERRLVAMHLQSMEANPLDADDIAMFEMFEREGWSSEKRLDHIRKKALAAALAPAAE